MLSSHLPSWYCGVYRLRSRADRGSRQWELLQRRGFQGGWDVGSGNFYNNVGPESLCVGICPLLSLLGPRADRSGDSKLVATKKSDFA